MGSVVHDVLGYHTARGIQVESTWGGILFVAQRLGTDAPVGYSYGALHFAGHLADVLKPVSSIASLVALVVVTAVVWRRRREQSATLLAESTFVLLALELALGSVFSPQYLVWLIALGAAVACINGTKLRNATLFLLPAAVLTQLLFPFLYNELLVATTKPVAILWIRNLTILGIGLWGLWKLWVGRVSDPSTEELASR
jgi:hypothetical protein